MTASRKRAEALAARSEQVASEDAATRHFLLLLEAEFRALADEAERSLLNAFEMIAKCAPCLAGLCSHRECTTSNYVFDAVTDVAGTSSCGDCAAALLELVLHPPAPLVMTVPGVIPPG